MEQITKSLSFIASAACLSTMLFMSSCSKDDAIAPSPEATVTNDGSNLKTNLIGSGYGLTPDGYLPSTNGSTCVGCEPSGWSFKFPQRDATSSLTAYAGNSFRKWIQPLPVPSTGRGSIITVVSDVKYSGEASANITNLVKGKKYRFTFNVATTSLNNADGPSPYAHEAAVRIYDSSTIIQKVVDFTGKKNQWITEAIEFEATGEQHQFQISGRSLEGETKLAYTNIHVGPNAVKIIN